MRNLLGNHCVKDVRIRSFSGLYFTIFELNSPNPGKYGPEKLRIRTFYALSNASHMYYLIRRCSLAVVRTQWLAK